MAELIGLGRPVSAHDPELLERLGWSRPYAQRILSHLESAGLLRAIPERNPQRTGRPRKLYEPSPSPGMSLREIYEKRVFDNATTDKRRASVYIRSGELGIVEPRADVDLMRALAVLTNDPRGGRSSANCQLNSRPKNAARGPRRARRVRPRREQSRACDPAGDVSRCRRHRQRSLARGGGKQRSARYQQCRPEQK